ncbi:MAG: hypothetical protein P0Y65_00235 [Candidatus Devosia phytovorans]|uniref:Uncharacterized protein n=1 Tax=Candidatus Devosia phytovorans TaxID=3121372 RepID=A0AAJ5VTV4_9HYPH|nr:hypothetical protein [Devosia sp.]WEK04723.1 MAG: hypothetical protein P0Y65_00235 [Devosia sp.]
MMAETTAGAGVDQLVANAKLAYESAFAGVMMIGAVLLFVLSFVLAMTFRPKQGEPEVAAWSH